MERHRILGEWLQEGSEKLGITLDGDHIDSFILYLSELKRWNKKTNLTAIKNDQEIIAKHFFDSMACTKALDAVDGKKLLDVGSGAGFPGIPIKILHPSLKVSLVEPNQKKIAFLRHIVGTLHLHDCFTIGDTIQNLVRKNDYLDSFGFIVIRALSVTEFEQYFSSLLVESGKIILFRASSLKSEDHVNGFRIFDEIAYEIPFGYGRRVLTVLEKCK